MKPLVIYHSPCPDGFTAAWCLTATTSGEPQYEFVPGTYGQPAPDVRGRDVILLDYSYKEAVVRQMAAEAASFLVLDHHASAERDLAFLPLPVIDGHIVRGYDVELMRQIGPCAVFDMGRSGAGLAWDFFNWKLPRPKLVDVIEDRDLWKTEVEGSREAQAVVLSHEYSFENWDGLAGRFEEDYASVVAEGTAILRRHMKDVREIVARCATRGTIAGFDVPIVNVPYTYGSDAANIMCQGEPFAAYYYDKPGVREWGLRSTDSGEDVSKIAASLGGGGHRNASGFRTPLPELGHPGTLRLDISREALEEVVDLINKETEGRVRASYSLRGERDVVLEFKRDVEASLAYPRRTT
jgi:hypothetical protein